ncbi:glycosyltransferase family 9 protein [Cupriavidus consociatus]|uniref:glycosyltransferase family 9 protein n=1 Tax=Cupriavidus consociatus TaxID=2821357 RepID=UPI001AE1F49A|nr:MULTISPECIES: glycosyltransferase family 9 protein [unclassified Cupriavidus]MBP0623848.1 glycosyltransferase family 9 protein [Cupriavidus sp. LEh25]MDK2660555.1 glycosyltransferase family 9 protein [Cupriavidus sp. LEh21]
MTTWQTARQVLCVRLDNMGDVLMSTPAMQALAESMPGRRLTLLTSHAAAALAPHLPMVKRVLAWNAPWARHDEAAPAAPGPAMLRCARWLGRYRFDAAVIFTVYSQSPLPAAMLCALAGIPLRLACCRENPYALLTDWVPEREPAMQPGQRPRHEARRQLDLVAQVGAGTRDTRLRFRVLAADRAAFAALAAHLAGWRSGRGGPLVVVHPGASAASRRWPAARFAEVARALATQAGAHVLVTGADNERETVHAVCAGAHHARVVPLAGALTLGEMGALLEAADLLVSNNTGPVHLAAALGTPVVDLYALTNPQHTPWQVPHHTLFADVPCRYCYKSTCPQGHHRCLEDVPAALAVQAALALLAGDAQALPAHPLPWPGAADAPLAGPATGAASAAVPVPALAAARTVPAVPAADPPSPDEVAHVHPWH